MPRFGFYFQDILPTWKTGKTHAGEDVGCELGLRRNQGGDSEVYVKVMDKTPRTHTSSGASGECYCEVQLRLLSD